MLAALGAQTVDADALVRWTYNDPAFRAAVADRFGPEALAEDGSVDRVALAGIVFQDTGALDDLEQLVHPAVLSQIVTIIQAYRADPAHAPLLAVEIPLLYETGAEAIMDRVLCVVAPYEERARRLRQRGWTDDRIAAVEMNQMSQDEKAARADDVVEAAGTVEQTAARVEAVWVRLVGGDASQAPSA
jgi:dephospho-CoA kinase